MTRTKDKYHLYQGVDKKRRAKTDSENKIIQLKKCRHECYITLRSTDKKIKKFESMLNDFIKEIM